MIFGIVLLTLLFLVLAGTFVCFLLAFYSPDRPAVIADEDRFPPGEVYVPYHPRMRQWAAQVDGMDYETLTATSRDGLSLMAKYYELTPDSPVEILFPGYRGMAERDLCGAVQRCFSVGHSAILVDQRAGGRSNGHIITFGVKESEDALVWAEAVTRRFGESRPIVLAGVSMGATTIMLAAGKALPPNVVGVLADCGYTTAPAIIKKVIRQMKLPADLLYPLVRLGAILYGGFDPNEADCPAALARATVPVILFHGEADDFVPCEMSRENYAACASPKRLLIIPGAGHGLSYPADEEGYVAAVKEFDQLHWRQ